MCIVYSYIEDYYLYIVFSSGFEQKHNNMDPNKYEEMVYIQKKQKLACVLFFFFFLT